MSGWTPDAEAKLRELWALGVSSGQIAKRMSFSRSMVCAKAARLNLRPRNGQVHRAGRAGAAPAVEYDRREPYDPRRADKLLRRFSWQGAAE